MYVKNVNYVKFASKLDVIYVKYVNYVNYVINVGKKQAKFNMKHPKDKDLE